jgi:uncharacterized protein YlxW (UPF0749 family)
MDNKKKLAIVGYAVQIAIGIADAVFIHWVGNINWWVAWSIAGAVSAAAGMQVKINENRKLFDIADAELVRVSALSDRLEEKVSELQEQLEQTESRIADLEFKPGRE